MWTGLILLALPIADLAAEKYFGRRLAAFVMCACGLMGSANAMPDMALAVRGGFDPGVASAFSDVSVLKQGVKYGWRYGLEYDVRLLNRLNLRLMYMQPVTTKDTVYETEDDAGERTRNDFHLQGKQSFALLDWFVFGGKFRLSFGGVDTKTRVDLSASNVANPDPHHESELVIGENSYPLSRIGPYEKHVEFGNGFVPYLGLGVGNPLNKNHRFSVTANVGYMFTDTPKVTAEQRVYSSYPRHHVGFC